MVLGFAMALTILVLIFRRKNGRSGGERKAGGGGVGVRGGNPTIRCLGVKVVLLCSSDVK